MKIKLLIIFLCLGSILYANEFNVYIGVDAWRHDTGIEDTGDPGLSIGAEYLFSLVEDRFYLGLGGEFKSKMRGFNDDSDYSPIFGYIKAKLFLYSTDFYILSSGGYSYNENRSNPGDNGAYIAAGFGYDFTKTYIELVYELFDIHDNDDLFNNGNLQTVGLKLGYKF